MELLDLLLNNVWTLQFWLALSLAVILVFYLTRKRYNLPPRPHGWPFIGNMFAVDQSAFHRWCQKIAKTHGPVFRVTFGPADAVVVNDIKYAQIALVDHAKDFSGRPMTMLFGEGSENYQDVAFANPDSPLWANDVTFFAVSVRNYTNGRVYEQLTGETFSRLKTYLDEKADSSEPFDPKKYCKLFLYNQIAGLCFNKTYNMDDEEFVTLIKIFEDCNNLFTTIQISDLLPFLNYLPFPMPDSRRARAVTEYLWRFLRREIKQHKETFTGKQTSDLTYYILKMTAEDETLQQITEVQQRQIIGDVFAAGVDTSQIQYRWLLLFLAAFPNIQEKIYEEILETVGPIHEDEDDLTVSSADYKTKMPYSEAFLLETTRYGTVALLGLPRKTMGDTKLGEWDIPKCTQVIFNQYAINFDENQYSDPHEFRPERFLTENGLLGPRPFSYMPFGMGRRACPGESAARNTLWMLMIMMLRRYQILPPEGVKLTPKYSSTNPIISEPENYEIRLKYRN